MQYSVTYDSRALFSVEFASICQRSTDFHFPDLDKQFCMIQQNLEERRKKKLQKVVVVLRQEMTRLLRRQGHGNW